MTKREKVAKGLECRLECGCMNEDNCNSECPYLEDTRACYGLDEDALILLKAQEPVKPLDENYWKHTMGRCGHCKAPLPAIEGLRSKFCWMCGNPVKWDD